MGARTAIAAGLALALAALGGAARATPPSAPVEPAVLAQAAEKGEATFWVVLTRTAEASRSGLRSLLRKRGVP